MRYLEEKTSIVSTLIENQFPQHVQENNSKFLSFLTSYYESQEGKYGPFDIASNLSEYYNISYFRPNRLVESVELSSDISSTDTTITVSSTKGYPRSGYIRIDSEIIFYKSKTATTFNGCVRGTDALVLTNVPKSEITLEKTSAASHTAKAKVYNVAFNYSKEFFKRIKSELGVLIPEVLDESLDVGAFLKNIKSFYSAKGSLNSHRIVFRILFNDRRFDLKLKDRGTGAVLEIPNLNGSIPDPVVYQIPPSVFIKNGGTGYDNRKTNNVLINAPVIDILGTGTGIVNPSTLIRDNTSAVIKVTDIDSNGVITDIEVSDIGTNYVGPIVSKVRPRKFIEDQIVRNDDGTGVARVEYYDSTNETVILYDVIGNFRQGQEIFSTTDEQPRAFISSIPSRDFKTRKGVEILSENQEIEFPREYTFKTSTSKADTRKIIRCKLIDGYSLSNDVLPDVFSLTQDSDKLFGVKGVDIEIDNRIFLTEDIFEFEIGSNSDISDIYLQPDTVITKSQSISTSSSFVITVDDASGFPVTNGIISIAGKEITYRTRNSQQFFGCSYTGTTFTANVKDVVVSFGRYKLLEENDELGVERNKWITNVSVSKGDYRFYNDRLYIADTAGTTGSTAPVHSVGRKTDGGVVWRFVGPNRYDHSFYIDQNGSKVRFRLFGMPGDIIIEQSGSLNSLSKYEFAKFDSPNIDVYNFELDNEAAADRSDRLALILSANYNRTRTTVNDSRLPSYQSLTGFSSHYDYDEYIYLATSGIPPWWEDIVTLPNSGNIDAEDQKKVNFTDQKLVSRWKKDAILYSAQGVSQFRKTKKLIALQVDAIQVNSYKGNTVQYGYINKFSIASGGNYGVSYAETSGVATSFDEDKNPKFSVSQGSTQLNLSNSNDLTKISASFTKVNFTDLFNDYESDLSGFDTEPTIDVVSQNPQTVLNFTNISASGDAYPGMDKVNNIVTKTSHGLKTSDKVTFIADDNYFQTLTNNTEYFVRVIDTNRFTLHKTKSQSLLNDGVVSLQPLYVSPPTPSTPGVPVVGSNVTFRFETDIVNPYTGFEAAKLELGYANGKIDNIFIRQSGKGYINMPKIIISGGGKNTTFEVPFSKNGVKFIEMSGPIVSHQNYSNKNYNIININDDDGEYAQITTSFEKTPSVDVVSGRNAAATAFIGNGSLVSVVLSNAGEFYTIAPTVEVIGDGKDATVEARITANGEIERFVITNPGTGYTTAPQIKITPVGTGGSVTASLKEWTFNLVRQLNKYNRIDSFGGYVYDAGDATPTTHNDRNFKLIDYKNDFPDSIDNKHYLLIQSSAKLAARQIRALTPPVILGAIALAAGKSVQNLTDEELLGTTGNTTIDSQTALLHSPAICVSYDGTPVYFSGKANTKRNEPISLTNVPTEIKSRYKLKYTEVNAGTTGAITLSTTAGTKYVTLSRTGGPSLSEYPIGSFIEDYEFVEGNDNDLDVHNGRFCITPEFPEGRYVYFVTTSSYDAITNALVTSASANNNSIGNGFNGFPYFIGDTFASEYDDYMNNRCRTTDKIPSNFVRAFEKEVPQIISNGDATYFGGLPAGATFFAGLGANTEYPQEDTDKIKSVAETGSISGGKIDAIIIENKGDNYKVGDRLKVDNSKTFGSGFSGFVSKIGGKTLTNTFLKNNGGKKVTFQTTTANELAVGDLIEFKYNAESLTFADNQIYLPENNTAQPVSPNLTRLDNVEVSIREGQSFDTLKDKLIYSVTLNSNFKYELQLPGNSEIKVTYDIESVNEYFTLIPSPTDTIRLDMTKVPNRLYLHVSTTGSVDEWIYQIDKVRDYIGSHTIVDINQTLNQFTVDFPEDTLTYETKTLYYFAQSYGASGPVEEVTITNQGNNYRKLPAITGLIKKGTTSDVAGDGKAILQANSDSIGKIKRIYYDSIGTSFTSNKNANYYLNVPATAKIINNFEIYDVEILNPGQNYDGSETVLVDGSDSKANIKLTISSGTITKVDVVDGGMNFAKEPVLTISTNTGTNGSLRAKIRRKRISAKQSLTGNVNSLLFPIAVNTTVVSFDEKTSTLEFDEVTGQFKENDTVYLGGKAYGKIVSIRKTKAYAKISSYAELRTERTDINGNPSEYLQKLTDSDYYQDWSYSLTSSRDTKEWRRDQDALTHPAGFKQFGKKRIERRKSIFRDPQNILQSNVSFGTKFFNKINLETKLGLCGKQTLAFSDTSGFAVGDFYFGIKSGAIGEVESVTDFFVRFLLRNDKKFVEGESIVKISLDYAIGNNPGTFRSIVTVNGIIQEPVVSYDVATDYLSVQSFIPKFDILANDVIIWQKLQTPFQSLDSQTLSSTDTSFSLTNNGNAVTIDNTNLENFIFSIGGSVQNPNNITVTNNIVSLGQSSGYDSKLFAIKHDNLRKLTFTGSGTTYTLNYTPSDDCNLLVFVEGASQSELVTDYTLSGNTITFSESVDSSRLFGWEINETVTCEQINVNTLLGLKTTFVRDCITKRFTQNVESNAVKKPDSIYEIRKDQIDGTVFPESGTKVSGFDTKFTYTTPRYSKSYVEVLDKITFNGSTTTFGLTRSGDSYTPENGEESLVVYIDDDVLDYGQYSVSGSNITFSQTYASSVNCTIIDYESSYMSNITNENGTIIDRLNVSQNGIKTTFNLSDRGVPKYVQNVGDVFVIKNGLFQVPNVTTQSFVADDDQIIFANPPTTNDNILLPYFNRQLLPEPSKNVIIDPFRCADGTRTEFPFTIDGLLTAPVNVNNVFVVRNGVYQKPVTDYTITNTHNITFTTAPVGDESDKVIIYYSYDGLNQNILLDDLTNIDGVNTTHNLLNGGSAFTPPNADDLMVVRNGVVQNPGENYTTSGSTITFSTALTSTDSTFIIYTHGAEELSISSSGAVSSSVHRYTLGSAIAANDSDEVVIFADGVPRFFHRSDFTVENNGLELHLTHTDGITPQNVFIMKYASVTLVDNFEDCENNTRTRFRLIYSNQNLDISNTANDADLLVVKNGVVLQPGVEYTLTANRRFIDFTSAPADSDNIFIVRMLGNLSRTLTTTGTTNQYTISTAETTEKENVVIFSNNTWKFAELGDFTWNNDNTITLSSAHTTGNLFAIKFYGIFNLLDQINTPFDGSRTEFNMFNNEENFVPSGTIANDSSPHETSILVTKNGSILDPGVDYTLTGDIKSRITFTTAPVVSDVISIRSVGSFDKLDTITGGSGTQFNITKGSNPYYANYDIDRPKKLENQILVIMDGKPQSPLYDYIVRHDKLIFKTTVSFAKLVLLDFRGTVEDVAVTSRNNEVSVGDKLYIEGELLPRVVTDVHAPDLLTTQNYTGEGPSGFAGTTTISGGRITGVTVTSNGLKYKEPVVLRTVGSGIGAKILATTDYNQGGTVTPGDVVYPGNNVYYTHDVYATVYASVYKELPVHKTELRRSTKLGASINSTVEQVTLENVYGLTSNAPVITASGTGGSNASFRAFVSNGEIRKVDILNAGTGYDDRDVELTVTGGGGTGCVLRPTLDGNGAFTSVSVENGGVGYDTNRVILYYESGGNVTSEIIEYTDLSATSGTANLLGCTRGAAGTTATSHDAQIETPTDDANTYTSVYFDNYL